MSLHSKSGMHVIKKIDLAFVVVENLVALLCSNNNALILWRGHATRLLR